MSVKLRDMAALDPEWAQDLKTFFMQNGISESDYLELTYAEFLEFSEEYLKKLAEVLQKHEHKV
jgi:hypothetical protein